MFFIIFNKKCSYEVPISPAVVLTFAFSALCLVLSCPIYNLRFLTNEAFRAPYLKMVPSFVQPCTSIIARLSVSSFTSSTSSLLVSARRIIPSHGVSLARRYYPHFNSPVIRMTTSSSTPPPPSSSTPPTPPPPRTDQPVMVRARHILVDSESLLDTIRTQIDNKEKEFAELAKLVSKCPSKDRGGDLGWFRRNVMVKAFEQAAFNNAPGSYVKVQTEFGWHLILVDEHASGATTITVQEFAVRFVHEHDENVQFVDCRERGELELAKLNKPNFLNLPMGEYDQWAEDLDSGKLSLQKDKETVVMCHHGMRSANFCSFLSQQGFEHVRNLVGGIDEYAKTIDSSVPTYGDN